MLLTVDPRYNEYVKLYPLLTKLHVVAMKTHRISIAASLIGSFKPKPHWIQLAVVSTTRDYMEFIPYSEAKAQDAKDGH